MPQEMEHSEVTVTQPIDHDLTDPIERLAELNGSATLDCIVLERFLQALCSSAFMSLMVDEKASGVTVAQSP